MRHRLEGVALLTLCGCITFSTLADAQDKRTLTENCSVVVIPQAGRPPLTVMAQGTVVDALKVEGEWIQITFEDPRWGRRVGYIADTCVGVVHPKPAGPAASPTPAPAQRPEQSAPAPQPAPAAAPPLKKRSQAPSVSLWGQDAASAYADRMRKMPPLGVAIVFLKHQQMPILLDQVRRHPNVTITSGPDLITAANVEQFAKETDGERQVLADVIRQRGFMKVDGVYDLRRDPRNQCYVPPELRGPITISQADFTVELKDPITLFSMKGVIVESSIAAVPSVEAITPTFFVGEVVNRQVELGWSGEIRCKIGILSRQGASRQ
jgi:hypothetical protein